jgi:hypothetical protein
MLSTTPSLLSMSSNYNLTIFNFSSFICSILLFSILITNTRVPSGITHLQSCTDLLDTRASFLGFDCLLLLLLLLL